ncbi:anaphase-promoting complex subunit 2 [Microdochium nivale]|nr:anaphase-promoting complex subunit 2 [Microdochium nivale]
MPSSEQQVPSSVSRAAARASLHHADSGQYRVSPATMISTAAPVPVQPRWNARQRRAIQAVFPANILQPTPQSTPASSSASQGQPFGALSPKTPTRSHYRKHQQEKQALLAQSPENVHAQHQTRFDRSWHRVTSHIALPPSVTAEDSFGALPADSEAVDGDRSFDDALLDVLDPASRLPLATHTDDILDWHAHQVRQHYVNHVLPLLAVCDGYSDQTQVLLGSIRTLEAAQRQYHFGLTLIARGLRQDDSDRALRKFSGDLHAIVGNSMSASLLAALRQVLSQLMRSVLGVSPHTQRVEKSSLDPNNAEAERARKEIHQLVDSLCSVGLAGERFQTVFAELLNDMMVLYVSQSFAGKWEAEVDVSMAATDLPPPNTLQTTNISQLVHWIENQYSKLAVEVTGKLGSIHVSWTIVEKWKDIAVGRLASLRVKELFDMIANWPDSAGGVMDLRFSVTTPERRLQLTQSFSAALQERLLHSGRSTLEILRTYIAMIKAFHQLDHSRVLLDRVAFPLQLYLCTRDDTVRIIVAGLLSNPEDVGTDARKTKLVELVELLHGSDQQQSERQDEEWDDLTWVPPPVDAGLNYKRRKSEDVIGTLIGAVGSPEVFIKEFQAIIGQRLLSNQTEFDQEIEVLELLKKRFGESPLQACDVMVKDIQDSTRLDAVIQKAALRQSAEITHDRTIHARILSRLFWPDMGEERFSVPSSVIEMQKTYEDIYSHLKPSRKVKWLNHLGQATVELELEDRKVSRIVHTYEAAVIDAFSEDGRPSWTFEDLWIKLEMDEDLLTSALEFWQRQQVLSKIEDHYTVLERLPDAQKHKSHGADGSSSADAPGGDGPATPPRKARPAGMSEKEKQQRQVYWQFIVGMLTNSSAVMPLGQIAMMMKMLIADGFPWSNEELQEFLGEKVAAGEVELVTGGKYKLVKK